eukprot:c11872_g1_i1.p1 GENE.c11872_g1_i1~~c11872_g1_i1.p1  ORF type:complete len:151 (+),score=32.04 c11872_g1_i1:400-852(+)
MTRVKDIIQSMSLRTASSILEDNLVSTTTHVLWNILDEDFSDPQFAVLTINDIRVAIGSDDERSFHELITPPSPSTPSSTSSRSSWPPTDCVIHSITVVQIEQFRLEGPVQSQRDTKIRVKVDVDELRFMFESKLVFQDYSKWFRTEIAL